MSQDNYERKALTCLDGKDLQRALIYAILALGCATTVKSDDTAAIREATKVLLDKVNPVPKDPRP